jgi:hypothetical protein
MYALIDEQRETFGVEPICAVLQIAPASYRRHAARERHPALRIARAQRDSALMPKIQTQLGTAQGSAGQLLPAAYAKHRPTPISSTPDS